jgi:hypothetical protein
MQERYKMPNINLKEILDELLAGYRTGQTERQQDKAGGIAALQQAISLFDENYGKGTEKKALASYNQGSVGKGMAGSTRGAAVSTGMKQEFEDMRRGKLGDALTQLAQFFSNFNSQRPDAGNVAYAATGGFGGQMSLEAQRFAQEQASYPSVISGNQQGLGYQPPSFSGGGGGGGGTTNPFLRGSFGNTNVSGSTVSNDSAWGSTPQEISKQAQIQNSTRQTVAGMWTTRPGDELMGDRPAPWSPGSAYSLDAGGWYTPA